VLWQIANALAGNPNPFSTFGHDTTMTARWPAPCRDWPSLQSENDSAGGASFGLHRLGCVRIERPRGRSPSPCARQEELYGCKRPGWKRTALEAFGLLSQSLYMSVRRAANAPAGTCPCVFSTLDVVDRQCVVRVGREHGCHVKTISGRIICLSGIWSIVMPSALKCAGGSMCVPYWPTRE